MVVARYVRLSIFILSLFFSYTCPFVYTLQYLENPQTKTFVLLLGDCHRHGDIDAKHGQLLIKFLANLSGAPFKTLMIKESEDENTFVMPTQCFKSEGVSNDENADQASAQQPVQEEKPSFISVIGHEEWAKYPKIDHVHGEQRTNPVKAWAFFAWKLFGVQTVEDIKKIVDSYSHCLHLFDLKTVKNQLETVLNNFSFICPSCEKIEAIKAMKSMLIAMKEPSEKWPTDQNKVGIPQGGIGAIQKKCIIDFLQKLQPEPFTQEGWKDSVEKLLRIQHIFDYYVLSTIVESVKEYQSIVVYAGGSHTTFIRDVLYKVGYGWTENHSYDLVKIYGSSIEALDSSVLESVMGRYVEDLCAKNTLSYKLGAVIKVLASQKALLSSIDCLDSFSDSFIEKKVSARGFFTSLYPSTYCAKKPAF